MRFIQCKAGFLYSNTSQTSASIKHTICVPLEKSIYVSNYLWGLRRSRCFFLSLPPLSSLEMFVSLSLIFPLYFSLNFDIRTYPKGCLSQTAVQHCDNAFVLPNLFMNFLFSYPFFCSFPQGLAHLMLNRQGMGSIVLLFPPSHLNTQRSFSLLCCTNISSPLFIFYIYCLFILCFLSCYSHYSLNICPSNPCPDHWLSFWNIIISAVLRQGNASMLIEFLRFGLMVFSEGSVMKSKGSTTQK